MRANRYVSYLGTEIEPKALTTLTQFERATERVFERIEAFSNNGTARLGIGALSGLDARSQQNINGTTSALARARAEAARTAPAVRQVTQEATAMSTAFLRSAQALNVVQGPLGPLAGRLSSLGYIFRDLAGISLASVLGGGGAFLLGSIASDYQRVTDRLRPFYETQKQTNAAMRDVIQIARDTRQALDPVAQLYTRINQAGKDAGITTGLPRLTETVAKAARLSGGDADTQAAGLTQFAQGFGAGTLNGDELKSIRENTFRLAKALADGLGVPIAKLKELGAEGRLTPKIIAEALARSADQIDLEFSRLPKRIGASLTEAGNNVGVFIGRIDEAAHATQGIAEAISALGNNIPATVTVLTGLATVFAVRNMSRPIDAATASLARFAQTQAAVMAGNASPLTPRTKAAGRNLAQANRSRDAAIAQTQADNTRIAAQRKILFDLDAQAEKVRKMAGLETSAATARTQAADRAVTRAEVLVVAAQEELAAVRATAAARAQANTQAAVAARTAARAALAEANEQVQQAAFRASSAGTAVREAQNGPGSRSDRRRAEAVALRQQAVAEAELAQAQSVAAGAAQRLTAAQAELTAARAASRATAAEETAAVTRLAGAEAELAAATRAAAAADVEEAAAARANATANFQLLSIAEQRIAAEVGLAAATRAAAASTAAQTAAIATAAAAQRAFAATTTFVARGLGILQSGLNKLVAFLGGPMGIAITGITVGLTYLATRTDEAKEAAARFDQQQEALASRLGKTTTELQNQSAAARQLRVALAEAGLERAKQTRLEAARSLAGSLGVAAMSVDLSTAQGRADFARLNQVAGNLNRGQNSGIGFEELRALQQRNPRAFEGSSLSSLVGANPADYAEKTKGLVQTVKELRDAEQAVLDARKAADAPPLKPIDFNGPTHRTVEQLRAYAADAAEGGTILANAREKFAKTKADLDAELTKRRKEGDYSFDDEYVRRLSAAQTELNRVGDSQRAAAAGAAAHRKEIAQQNKALREAEVRAEKLADIQARYTEAPRAVDRAENDKRAIDAMFVQIRDGKKTVLDSVRVGDAIFTREEAEAVKKRIDESVRQPIADALRDQGRELSISRLILQGRGDEAELLRQKYELIDRVGDVTDDELAKLRRNAAQQRQINEAIAQRQRLIDVQARSYGTVLGSIRDLIANPLDAPNIGKNLLSQFRAQMAERLTLTLFGDPEAKFRDDMTRGLNASAVNLTSSAGNLATAAGSMTDAAAAVKAAGDAIVVANGGTPALNAAAAGAGAIPRLNADVGGLMRETGLTVGGAVADAVEDAGSEILVTAKRLQPKDPANLSTEERYNQVGKELAAKVFGPNSVLTKAASKLGTFTSGAGVGMLTNNALGIGGRSSQAQLGAAIGGGLGKTFLSGSNGILSKGLTAISSKLGSFAGPLGSIAGSVVGSVLGGLFKKTKSGSAVVTSTSQAAAVSGSNSSYRGVASGLGESVQSGIAKIADALGGSAGNFAVTIGKYGESYKVNTTGSSTLKKGKNGVVDFDEDQEGAIRFAILDALKDGAIKGIREGAKRLLQAGKDLDTALQNALDFQNVFVELKQYTDPVGAAIDALNLQFDHLVDIFKQAGASQQEFADLEKLYELKRADAIKEATNGMVSALDDFVRGLTSGSESPYNKLTTYQNAQARVAKLQAAIDAGQQVDPDELITALSDLKDASRNYNGSGQGFFTDFEKILDLAEKAKATAIAGGTDPSKAPSPFDSSSTGTAGAPAAAETTDAVKEQTAVLAGLLQELIAQGKSKEATAVSSAIAKLPMFTQ